MELRLCNGVEIASAKLEDVEMVSNQKDERDFDDPNKQRMGCGMEIQIEGKINSGDRRRCKNIEQSCTTKAKTWIILLPSTGHNAA